MTERFGGGIDKWMYGFKFVWRHVRSLVYPTILGLNDLQYHVTDFPAIASTVEAERADLRV